ncbi:MAG TPA: HAMP domain-containing sensor histidine kinase [Polyangia bacterium]|nr:HAMP domain-containing sensor histidine kinase [Polyangia bacterium]
MAKSIGEDATVIPVPSHERASAETLEAEVRTVSHSPIVSALLEAVDAGLLVLNPERQILATNRAPLLENLRHQRRSIGLRPGEFFSCPRATEQPEGCGASEHCLACGTYQAVTLSQAGRRTVEQECLLTTGHGADATPLELNVRATQVDIDGKDYTVVSLRDISHEKRRQALERIFFHDILNTLSALSNWTHLLNNSIGERQDRARERVSRLVGQLEREIQLQRTLLEAEQGTLRPQRVAVAPATLLADLQGMFADTQTAKQRALTVEDRCPGVELVTDPVLLGRVLVNMVKNAFEATPVGGEVRLWCERETGPTAEGEPEPRDTVAFHVHNAAEIPPVVASRVFQRSFTTKAGTGHGLGTYGMRLLGERYLGGRVSFTTSVESGTVFSMRLPLPAAVGAGI